MTKTIGTLRDDIYSLFKGPVSITPEQAEEFGLSLAKTMVSKLSEARGKPSLRLSNLGKACARQLWYGINTPEVGDELPPAVRLKFLFGDVLESLLLFLAKIAGHTVENEQRTVSILDVVGHIDATIDGVVVDVKSASTYSFKKFDDGLTSAGDAFGYLTQLGSYVTAMGGTEGSFLVIDKTLGNITVDTHFFKDRKPQLEALVRSRQEALANPRPPARQFSDEPDGQSGNRKLCVQCSYCEFKKKCWPGLRTFAYAGKPVHLTVVVREPKVPELK